MRTVLIISVLAFIALVTMAAMRITASSDQVAVSDTVVVPVQDTTVVQESAKTVEDTAVNIRITGSNFEMQATLNDSRAAQDFASMLPLEVELEDYAKTEKIFYPERKLDTSGAPAGYDPSVGDITYYAPWGDVALFYKDFSYAAGLVSLGTITEGVQYLQSASGSVTVEQL